MLHLYEVDYNNDGVGTEFYIIANSSREAYEIYYFSLEEGNENIWADMVDVYDLQYDRDELEFIETRQEQLRKAKENLLKYNDKKAKYFERYLK